MIANLVAIQAVGDSDGIPGSSPRFGVARALSVAPSMLDLLLEDAKSSTFKHVFLPERWPSSKEPRNALVHAVLAAHGDVLPAAPEFLDVMKATGWDNVVNRMASKFSGNLKVLVTCGRGPHAACGLVLGGLRLGPSHGARPCSGSDGDSRLVGAVLRGMHLQGSKGPRLGYCLRGLCAIDLRGADVRDCPPDI